MAQDDGAKQRGIEVFVKGNRYQASRAASDRGIPFAFTNEHDGITTGLAPTHYVENVMAWFCEEPRTAPFPIGTCLHYSLAETRDEKAGAQ